MLRDVLQYNVLISRFIIIIAEVLQVVILTPNATIEVAAW